MAVSFDPVLLQPRGNFSSLLEHWTNIKGPHSVWAIKICNQISAKSQYLLIAQYYFSAWISQEVQLSQNGDGWIEQVQPPRRWQWLDTLFLPWESEKDSLLVSSAAGSQDHQNRWFTYLAAKNIILAFIRHWFNHNIFCFFQNFSSTTETQWTLLHHNCLSETCTSVQILKTVNLHKGRCFFQFFFGRNTELVTIWKVFKAWYFSQNKSLYKINKAQSLILCWTPPLVQQYQTNGQEWFLVWKTRFSAGDLENSIMLAYQRAG